MSCKEDVDGSEAAEASEVDARGSVWRFAATAADPWWAHGGRFAPGVHVHAYACGDEVRAAGSHPISQFHWERVVQSPSVAP